MLTEDEDENLFFRSDTLGLKVSSFNELSLVSSSENLDDCEKAKEDEDEEEDEEEDEGELVFILWKQKNNKQKR